MTERGSQESRPGGFASASWMIPRRSRRLLYLFLQADDRFEVVGEAANGEAAIGHGDPAGAGSADPSTTTCRC